MFQFLSRAAEEGENHSNVRKNNLKLGVVCYVGEVLFKDMCLVAQLCLFATPWTVAHQAFLSGDSPAKNTGVGCHALLQGIFPTQGSNPPLPHCRWILYRLTPQGSPRILQWVVCPFSRRTSRPRNQTRVLCIASTFFTS